MGPTYEHLHHYCWGLMKTNRALLFTRTQQFRTFYLNDAIKEFDYVIERAPRTFILLPEIFTKKGENLIRLGRGPLGLQELQRAIEFKPDYWPPYAGISDYFKETGNLAQAREWLEKGLSVTPDVKALQSRMATLEGARTMRKTAPQRPETTIAPQSKAEKSAAQPAPQPTEPQPPSER